MSETTARRSFLRSVLFFLPAALLISVASCDAPDPSGPGAPDILFKGKPSEDPPIVVSGFTPKEAEQEETFTLTVDGTGFQDGATVFIGRNGKPVSTITTIETRWNSLEPLQLVADIAISLEAEVRDDYEVVVSFRRGKGIGTESFKVRRGKPGEVSNYTITDLGTDVLVQDVNDDGVLVGSSGDQAAVWQNIQDEPPLLLPDPVGTGALALRINAPGTHVIGGHWNATQTVFGAVLWEIDLGTGSAMPSIPLDPLGGDDRATASGVNDWGQVVGQSLTNAGPWEGHSPVLWEPDGFGGMVGRDLGDLPGHRGAWAQGLNNAGHVVGRSGSRFGDGGRVVLWIVDGEDITIFDLTPLSDDTGDDFALEITDPSDDGSVQISGYSTVAGLTRPTVWTWDGDEENFAVTMKRLEELTGWGTDINASGEVAVFRTGSVVWTPTQNLVEVLPALSTKCTNHARRLNNVGTVVGHSDVWQKGRCTQHAVLWTKIN